MGKLRPLPAFRHAAPSTFIFKDQVTASHVFLRHGALRGALQAPYVGPYRVLQRGDKTYTTEVQDVAKTVFVDRLKPAYDLHVNPDSASTPGIHSASRLALDGGIAFPITWGCSGLSVRGGGGVVDATG